MSEAFEKSRISTFICLRLSKDFARESMVEISLLSHEYLAQKPCWKLLRMLFLSRCARIEWHRICCMILQHTDVREIGR